MGASGMNQKELPQLLSPENSIKCVNYLINSVGQLAKRKGASTLYDFVSDGAVTMAEEYNSDTIILGKGTGIYAYTISTDTLTNIKTDFPTSTFGFAGQEAMGYFFACNGTSKIWRAYRQISFSGTGQTIMHVGYSSGNVTAGNVVTGVTSGATATIDSVGYDSGSVMTLRLTGIAGTFQVNEVLTTTGLVSGSVRSFSFKQGSMIVGTTSGAIAQILVETETAPAGTSGTWIIKEISGTWQNGEPVTAKSDFSAEDCTGTIASTVSWQIAEDTASPRAKGLRMIGNRLYAFNLSDDITGVAYSGAYLGTGTPFTSWTVSATVAGAGQVSAPNLGNCNDVRPFGEYYVAFHDGGRISRAISQVDSNGTLSKLDQIIDERSDVGGKKALLTPDGLFFVNQTGINVIAQIGSKNVPFSAQEIEVTNQLGDAYFQDFDFSNASMVYTQALRYLFVACARGSATNNVVLAYHLDTKALTEITGWPVRCFVNINEVLYAGLDSTQKLVKLFDGFDDFGSAVNTELIQELTFGQLFTKKMLKGMYVQGFLSPSSEISVDFDIYTVDGRRIQGKETTLWTAQFGTSYSGGYGGSSWGESGWASDEGYSNLIESFDGCRPFIRNLMRLRLHITCSDKLAHIINWVALETEEKGPIRRRKMTIT